MVLRRLVCFWLSLDVLERPEKKEEGTWLTSNYSDSDYIVEDKNKDYINGMDSKYFWRRMADNFIRMI